MVRHVAYAGPEISLADLLLCPDSDPRSHGLHPWPDLAATIPVSGFGIGWQDVQARALHYRRDGPIGADHNLPALAQVLSSDRWVVAERAATADHPGGYVNTQPFAADGLLFSHIGRIEAFRSRIRISMQNRLAPGIESDVLGSSGSEYLFAMIRQLRLDQPDESLEDTLIEMLNLLESWLLPGQGASLNVLVGDGERLVAMRYASETPCPSLFFVTDEEEFPEGAVVIASEPLTPGGYWHAIPENHLLVVTDGSPPELIAI